MALGHLTHRLSAFLFLLPLGMVVIYILTYIYIYIYKDIGKLVPLHPSAPVSPTAMSQCPEA
jgi:hypothetical protein